jgi:hypothetical protein
VEKVKMRQDLFDRADFDICRNNLGLTVAIWTAIQVDGKDVLVTARFWPFAGSLESSSKRIRLR